MTLALASALILVVGVLFRPRSPETSPPPPPSELELVRLARLSQRRSLENTTQFFSAVADDGVRGIFAVEPIGINGVAWPPDLVVVPGSRRPLPETVTLRAADLAIQARLVVSGPHLPIAAFRTSRDAQANSVAFAQSNPPSGEWILAVWRDGTRRSLSPGTFVETMETRCGHVPAEVIRSTIAIDTTMAGAGVFDIDGGLVGIVAVCEDGAAILSHRSVTDLIARGRSLESRLLAVFGFRAEPPSLDEAAHLKITDGALVREVWNGYPADRSGLWPGDVILEIDGRRVGASADLAPMLERAKASAVTIQRGAHQIAITIALEPPEAQAADKGSGVVLESDRQGHRIDAVTPGSAAYAAGLRPGDILRRINHAEPRNLTQLRRLLDGSRSAAAFVEIERHGRRFGVLIS
jgi:S1-C subfamily serine protease